MARSGQPDSSDNAAQSPSRGRLLVVSPYYASHGGGVEIVAEQLAWGLSQRGFDVTWAASATDPVVPRAGIRCVPMPANNVVEERTGVPVPLWTPRALRQLWRLMRECDAVLMHESLYVPNLLAAAWTRCLGKPLLLVQHVGEVPYRSLALRTIVRAGNMLAARFAHICAARIVFVSDVVRTYFHQGRRAPGSKTRLIANGFDPGLFHPVGDGGRQRLRARLGLSDHRPALLFVGRFVEKKGLLLLEQLARQRPGWDWFFVGAGPIDPATWNIPQVRVVGRLAQAYLADWYRASDLLVLPSIGEGFPLVVQEAMACGLPAAVGRETAMALEGVEQMVFAGTLGTGDDQTLALWLELLDRAVGSNLAARREAVARFASERWSWERCVDQYMDVLASIGTR